MSASAIRAQAILETEPFVFTLEGAPSSFQSELLFEKGEDGIHYVHLSLRSDVSAVPPVLSLKWHQHAVDVQGMWHPAADRNRGLVPDWWQGFPSKATYSAPVISLYGNRGNNLLSFAFSDVLNPVLLQAGIHEELSTFLCSVTLFSEPTFPIDRYEAILRLDSRNIPYYETLQAVGEWWTGLEGCTPADVPETAKEPMYSTWYSFHQLLEPGRVEEQCRLAKELGCKAVIVDDGWQTADGNRGYAYCGDWKVSPGKIADMKAHVARVHELGLKYILWYSVPFIGKKSEAWHRFKDKMLYINEELGAGVVDPRFPEVREYLIGIYEQALLDWDLDGFKLDFVDSFYAVKDSVPLGSGRDTDSVPAGVDLLLSGVITRLRRLKPDVLIEFRQKYIGPLMRKYGNMFRAADCPNDAVQNRIRSIDIRLLCGSTAAHADMIMWNPQETVQSAALQIVNVLFSVPQISVLLDRLPAEHVDMLAFWLSFWREHRDVLLEGKLEPRHPELLYPLVLARTPQKLAVAAYHDTVISLTEEQPEQVILVNGTLLNRLVIELDRDWEERRVVVRDCQGTVVYEDTLAWGKGLQRLEVPAAGVVTMEPLPLQG